MSRNGVAELIECYFELAVDYYVDFVVRVPVDDFEDGVFRDALSCLGD